jgi:hypothetical protein
MDLQALAAAVAVVALIVSGCSAAGEPRPDSRTPVPAGLERGCPEPTTELRFPEGDLPEGATWVRLCPGPPPTDDSAIGTQIQAPTDLLTDGVAELVDLVNGQQAVAGGNDCTSDEGPVLAYWFAYPGGDWRAVRFDSYGCNILTVGQDLRREGGAELATAFTEALLTQRDGREAPDITELATCPASPVAIPRTGLVLGAAELASAAWCVSPRAQQVREVAIPPDLVQQLSVGLWPGLTTRSRRPCTEAAPSWIEGRTPWGDAVSYGIGSCGDIYPLHGATLLDDHGHHYLAPELDRALMALPLGPMVDHRD